MVLVRCAVFIGSQVVAALAMAAPSMNAASTSSISRASPSPSIAVSLEFVAPEGCSERERFESGLKARFDRIRLANSGEPGWSILVRLTSSSGGVHGELRLIDEHGESSRRAVDGADCPSVVEALSLTAALAIEQTVTLAELTDLPRNGEAPGAGPSDNATAVGPTLPSGRPGDASPRDVTAEEKPEAASDLDSDAFILRSYRLSAGLFGANWVTPQTSVGVRAELAYAPNWSSHIHPEFGIGASFVPVDFLQPRGALAVAYRGVSMLACPTRILVGRHVSILPCATVNVGQLTASTREVMVSIPSRRWQVWSGLDGRVETRLGKRASLELLAGLWLPLEARSYQTLEPMRQAGSTPKVSWIIGLGWTLAW